MPVRPLAAVLDLIAPPACAGCGGPIAAAAAVLCPACRGALPWLTGRRCPRCALPAHGAGRCPARDAAFAAAWAAVAHAGVARELVLALKFRGALRLADALAAPLAAQAPAALLDGRPLVPVPPDPWRHARRGFDAAALLAAALARRRALAVAPCLRRRPGSAPQRGARRHERLAAGRVQVAAAGRVPARATLVDDVHTTGATLDACARALRAAGCEEVVAVTYARTL